MAMNAEQWLILCVHLVQYFAACQEFHSVLYQNVSMGALIEVVARVIHQHQLTSRQVFVVGQRILKRNLQAAEGSDEMAGCMRVDKTSPAQAKPEAV